MFILSLCFINRYLTDRKGTTRKMLRKVIGAARQIAGELPKNFVYPLAVTVVGGVVAGVILSNSGGGGGHQTDQRTFDGTIDLNVTERGGAPIYGSVGSDARLVGRVQDGREVRFAGFCIGRAERSVSTGLPDERWFVLSSHSVVSAADVDGNPPVTLKPSGCVGDRVLPQISGLGAHEERRRLILHVQAPGATVVGFAALRPGDKQWHSLGLVVGRHVFSEAAGRTGAMAALAVVCWDEGVPAYAAESGNYIEELGSLGHASSSLRTAASRTVWRGRDVACAPPMMARREHHNKHPKPKHSLTPRPPTISTPPSTTVEVRTITTPTKSSPVSNQKEPGKTSPRNENNAVPAPAE